MLSQLRPAIVLFAALTLITVGVYPAVVTVVAKFAFPDQADGSVITRSGQPIGSSLIGQNFTDAKYFWPRPSSAGATGYDGANGNGSNLGPNNPALHHAVAARVNALRESGHDLSLPVPVDLVTASGSGLDPHISPESADYQVPRIARACGLPESAVRTLVATHTDNRTLGLLGEPRVNVLRLNLSLDDLSKAASPRARS